jgi:hypothetical protein
VRAGWKKLFVRLLIGHIGLQGFVCRHLDRARDSALQTQSKDIHEDVTE